MCDTREIPYVYKGESTIIPSVTGDFCPMCGEAVLEKSACDRVSSLMLDFNITFLLTLRHCHPPESLTGCIFRMKPNSNFG